MGEKDEKKTHFKKGIFHLMYLKFKAKSRILLNYKSFLPSTAYRLLLMFSWLLDKQTPVNWCYILPPVLDEKSILKEFLRSRKKVVKKLAS